MIDIASEQLRIVLKLLADYTPGCEVRAFGSRRNGNSKPHSDLDLAIVCARKLDLRVIADLNEGFEESALPFRVDVLEWSRLTPSFQRVIERGGYDVIQAASGSAPGQ
jgi:uncharacterized protein